MAKQGGGLIQRAFSSLNMHLLTRATDRGDSEAMTALGLQYSDRKQYAYAFRLWREAAAKNFPGAMFMLGTAYEFGNGVEVDKAEAHRWYQLAAELGDATSAHVLGTSYFIGDGVPKDVAEGLRWLKVGATLGDISAQIMLGGIYAKSEFIEPDQAEAVRWYSAAFDASKLDAALAHKYERELRWFLWAADRGDAAVLLNVANLYSSTGGAVPQNNTEALRWYHMAADKGSEDALCFLGRMYQDGTGVDKNFAEAMHWYRVAADRGNAGAMFNIAMLYNRSEGITIDAQQLYFWFRLCAIPSLPDLQRNYAHHALDVLKLKLLPENIGVVESRIRDWKVTHPETHYRASTQLTNY
jgi:TPR repeat protein